MASFFDDATTKVLIVLVTIVCAMILAIVMRSRARGKILEEQIRKLK